LPLFSRPKSFAAGRDGARFQLPRTGKGYAFFFDVDGTLIDIAPTPDSVVVPDTLSRQLAKLARRANGAVAVISGRSVAMLDQLLGAGGFAAAGLHGAEVRLAGGPLDAPPPPKALAALRPNLERLVAKWPGTLLEDKGAAIAVHYRGNPDAAADVNATVEAMLPHAGGTLKAQRGKMVIELKPANAGKGNAVRRLMAAAPFLGRTPLVIGDDVTDEEMFTVANEIGGVSIRVGTDDAPTAARYSRPDTAAVRAWLATFNS
jgi:trehalose 6-phosphate phosphatase